MSTMRCPHLKKWVLFTCNGTDTLYFPSAFQLEEYCKRKDHRKCPFFMTRISQDILENSVQLTQA
jgi:hypothetical protein